MKTHSISIPAKELRHFGLIMALILVGVFGIGLPILKGRDISRWPLLLGSIFLLLGICAPLLLAPVFRIWMRVGEVLGWVNSRLILGLVFALIVTPMAIILKIRRKDPLSRGLDKKILTYRIVKGYDVPEPTHMERPF